MRRTGPPATPFREDERIPPEVVDDVKEDRQLREDERTFLAFSMDVAGEIIRAFFRGKLRLQGELGARYAATVEFRIRDIYDENRTEIREDARDAESGILDVGMLPNRTYVASRIKIVFFRNTFRFIPSLIRGLVAHELVHAVNLRSISVPEEAGITDPNHYILKLFDKLSETCGAAYHEGEFLQVAKHINARYPVNHLASVEPWSNFHHPYVAAHSFEFRCVNCAAQFRFGHTLPRERHLTCLKCDSPLLYWIRAGGIPVAHGSNDPSDVYYFEPFYRELPDGNVELVDDPVSTGLDVEVLPDNTGFKFATHPASWESSNADESTTSCTRRARRSSEPPTLRFSGGSSRPSDSRRY